ncbi:response regulator [Pseudomonas sp. RA_5y_Pfl1_P24]|uniref:response regulator n=1 Tax=Pseudomonas sp. RA_5y_Pfl1_P24 TaxID=3088706 RepID=UPI0030DDB0B3
MPGNFPDLGAPEDALANPWSRVRVLVVDDHCTYRLLLGSLLGKLGVAHQCCCNGEQALQALAIKRFDLVISDCRMPVMDGYTMTRELRQREHAEGRLPITVLGMTASLGPEETRLCVACGMDGWLPKPIGFAQLRDALRCWLPPPQCAAFAGTRTGSTVAHNSTFPSRASLIEAFGSWDVVEPMLFSLIQEAHADLAMLIHAQATLDARMAAQCLHRLVGSVAFLGETGLEGPTVALINSVHSTGMALNRTALDALRHEVARYLDYLSHL